jgi:uncharacterized protein (TIGR02246 family)
VNAPAMAVATDIYAALEQAWNHSDGAAFGAVFDEHSDFVDIRGVHHRGGPAEIGGAHQGIFDTIYRDSVVRYEVDDARALSPDHLLAHASATLEVPGGPLAGVHHAVSTVVLVAGVRGWRVTAFHNTLVDQRGASPSINTATSVSVGADPSASSAA